MSEQMNERQMLSKLRLATIQDILPENVSGVLNMLPFLDPAVASKTLDFILSIPETANELTHCFKEIVETVNEANSNTVKAVLDSDRAIIDSFLRQSERDDFPPEERADIRNKIMEMSARMAQTDSRNKGFSEKLIDGAKKHSDWIWAGLLGLVGIFVGVKITSNNRKA